MGSGIVIANDSDIGGSGLYNEKRHKGSIISVWSVLKIWTEIPIRRVSEGRHRDERISNKDIRLCLPCRHEALV